MIEIPLIQNPNQELEIELNEQSCTITIRQLGDYVYMTLWLDSTLIEENAICMPLQLILQSSNAKQFNGNFTFVDTTSDSDHQSNPNYTDFDTRFKLVYLTADEVASYADSQ
jgi:hypothetical protein